MTSGWGHFHQECVRWNVWLRIIGYLAALSDSGRPRPHPPDPGQRSGNELGER